ncbi:dihydroxyacetone kinase subunit DhaL [Rubrobacter aplysinae]|uniref:dihydroxyacetone kinase subunit DhaL n=1 Tax=Rubrobacter aplysinae TaxID=909625 RepID=UPI00064BD7D4|nr:dihydroxyacetone kinase subunit DhaL [Rubrobacter aplysinae]
MGATESTVAAVRAMAAAMKENREHLTQLDAAIGDADHGTNMNRGFEAALERLGEPGSPAEALKAVSTALISKVGGSAGPLYGTAFLRASSELGEEVSAAEAASALEAALAGVEQRGKAEPGEKTMIDALEPAARAAREAAGAERGVAEVLRAAADAAREGAESTAPMTATKGRASYLGERSAGHVDPGAASTHLLLEAIAGSMEGQEG